MLLVVAPFFKFFIFKSLILIHWQCRHFFGSVDNAVSTTKTHTQLRGPGFEPG